jgi:hypothetical protein
LRQNNTVTADGVKRDAHFTDNTVHAVRFLCPNKGTRVEDLMNSRNAIFVPGYGVTEAIRSVRLIPKLNSIGPDEPRTASSPPTSATLEFWQGDLFGEPTKELLTTFSTSDRMATVYADGEMPLVRPRKTAVAIVRDAPDLYEIEFESEFIDPQDRTVRRTVTFDNYGTMRESLCEIKSSAFLKSIASRRNGNLRQAGSVARPLGRFFGRLTTSISQFFRAPPSETSLAARHDVPVEAGDMGLNPSAARLPSFASQSFDDSGASKGSRGRPTDLEVVPRAAE